MALTFLHEVRAISLKILKYEMNLSFQRKRLLFKKHYYPLDFVVFEHPTILGQYLPGKYQIQINKNLIYKCDEKTLQNIVRHELCHYIAHVEFGQDIAAHGTEFKSICSRYNYGHEVSSATIELGDEIIEKQVSEDKIYSKVKKLFQLAASDNTHEAELATIKANELLKKHHLNSITMKSDTNETVLDVVARGKKVQAKHETIYQIIKEFMVAPVFCYQSGSFSLEVVGTRSNVLSAKYVAEFLNNALELIYEQSKNENPKLRGVRAKKSFMQGIGQGYLSKIRSASKKSFSSQELIHCEQQVQEHLARAYPRLRGRQTRTHTQDLLAKTLGTQAGRELNINPGISSQSKKTLLLK